MDQSDRAGRRRCGPWTPLEGDETVWYRWVVPRPVLDDLCFDDLWAAMCSSHGADWLWSVDAHSAGGTEDTIDEAQHEADKELLAKGFVFLEEEV